MSWQRRVLGAAAVAGAGFVAARTLERRAIGTLKGRTDERLDPLYELPADVIEHVVATRDGGSIQVVERGAGRPLLLVHGILLQAAVWSPQLHVLADRFRVVAIDVRGHGRSVAGRDGFGRVQAANDVVDVLEALDLHQAIVMGQSMGGAIVMQFAGDHPDVLADRVDGLVFMATSGYGFVPPAVAPLTGAVGQRAGRRFRAGGHIPELKARDDDLSWFTARLAFGAAPSAKAVDQVRQFVAAVPQSTALPTAADLLEHDARQVLAQTSTPSMVLVGTQDRLTPRYAAKLIAGHLPNGRLEVLAKAGHQLMQERPFEVAELLDDFAAGLPPYGSVAPGVGAAISPASNGRSRSG